MGEISFKNVKQCRQFVKYLTLLSLCIFVANCSSDSPTFVKNSEKIQLSANAININMASAEALEKLPHIGAKTAIQIIEHRKRFGDFRRPEHILLVEGISDKRFRNMRTMIKVK